MEIVPYDAAHLDAIVALSLRAWEPVFASVESVMDPEVYREQHPDWRATQQAAVEETCRDGDVHTIVALEGATPVGFASLRCHEDDRIGEVYMIAVDPDHQQRGIGGRLTREALAWFAERGMTTAMIETGGDPGHAPARATYEAAGFRALPIARYFKKL